MKSNVLRCIHCPKRFSEKDVINLDYFPQISICFNCCIEMQSNAHAVDCFGKQNEVTPSGKVIGYGYDPMSADCRLHCDYSKVCRLFATGRIMKERARLSAKEIPIPFSHRKSLIARCFIKCMRGTTRGRLKRFIQNEGGSVPRIFRILRSGEKNGQTWTLDETGQRLKIFLED